MKICSRLNNFLFHPLDPSHSRPTKALAMVCMIALSILTLGVYAAGVVAVNLAQRVCVRCCSSSKKPLSLDKEILKKEAVVEEEKTVSSQVQKPVVVPTIPPELVEWDEYLKNFEYPTLSDYFWSYSDKNMGKEKKELLLTFLVEHYPAKLAVAGTLLESCFRVACKEGFFQVIRTMLNSPTISDGLTEKFALLSSPPLFALFSRSKVGEKELKVAPEVWEARLAIARLLLPQHPKLFEQIKVPSKSDLSDPTCLVQKGLASPDFENNEYRALIKLAYEHNPWSTRFSEEDLLLILEKKICNEGETLETLKDKFINLNDSF